MPFTHTRWGDLQVALAARLDDPNNVFWSQAENFRYLTEALRAWNAYAQYFRERDAFPITTPVAGSFFFNVLQLPKLAPTVTDQELILEIQNCLIEPENATAWTGSEQFTYQLIADTITRRRNQFLLETGMVISQSGDVPAVPPSAGRYLLDDKTIDVRRVAWRAILDDGVTPGDYSFLWRTDEAALTNWFRGWNNPAAEPSAYSVAASSPLTLQLAPPPNDEGFMNLLTIQTGPALDPANGPTILGIPDDYCWIIKYGVLQDLLSGNSPVVDLTRADYCQARWDEGIALARISASILNVSINEMPVEVGPVEAQDAFNANWMNSTPGAPYAILSAGWNLFAAFPIPDGVYGFSCDIIRNMPIPSGPANFVQIGREFIDTILDYSVHLASFKMGGQEFTSSHPNYESLVKMASQQNDKLRANAESFSVLQSREQAEGKLRPRQQSDTNLQAMNYAK